MNLIERAKNIVLQPKAEWGVIAGETTSTGDLYKSYVAPLAAIGPVASFIGLSLIGASVPFLGTIRVPLLSGLSMAIVSFVMALVGVFVIALVINALAANFGGEKDQAQALKAAAYSFTPAWLAGVLHLIPSLGVLVLLASLYGVYLLYLGLPVLMKAPEDKALPYTVVVVVCAIVVGVLIGVVSGLFGGMGGAPYGMTGIH
ncbi:MAG: Yip1 family protein [Gallionellaceae bacterium]|nr:Yip1 family protein [Gallionellaceae bacterium]